tara:strand:+ start:1611 stop:2297 length:687 start_codon:yes stop_codon:yes gene_type:complete
MVKRTLICALVVLSSFWTSTHAAIIVDTSLWGTAPSPSANLGPSGLTSSGGNQAVQNSNSYGTIVSDFLFNGDFNFSGTMAATTASFNDNDIFGLVFGWQDASNHYRLGWEQGGFNDYATGASGMFLVRESAGASVVLFEQEIFWDDDVDYNFLVGRTGNDISFSLNGINQTFTDTTFMTGRVGFYTESQTARFGGLASAPEAPSVSAPASFALFCVGFVLLVLKRRR